MKAYKLFYNEETKLTDYVEFEIANEFDFSNDPKTNIAETDGGHNIFLENVQQDVEEINRDIKEGRMKILKCKECGRYFYLPKKEEEWFADRGMASPKRCQFCRGKRKKQ